MFTVAVYLNVADGVVRHYRPGHPVAEVTTPEGTRLGLRFTTVADPTAAARAAYRVGNQLCGDDMGQWWPEDVRHVTAGDVLAVTDPHGHTTHLSIEPCRFSAISAPRFTVPLLWTTATNRLH